MTRKGYLAIVALSMLAVGCGGASDAPQLAVVDGSIQFEGKPLAGASVVFTPEKGPVAIGRSDEAGRFTLSTQGRPGAAVGSHRVTVQAFQAPSPNAKVGSDGESLEPAVSKIPMKYTELAKSGLTATVAPSADANKITLELK